MANVFQRTFGKTFYNAGPVMLTLFLILFLRVPFHDGHSGMFIPIISLIFTYYFRLHFPYVARLWIIFVLGLLEDFLSGGYLGMTPLILLMVAALFERYRNIFVQGTFWSDAFTFAFFSLGISLLYWLLTSFVEARFVPLPPFFIQGIITALTFPLFVILVGRLYKRFAR